MSQSLLPALILLALAPGASSADDSPIDQVEMAQLTIHQRIIIRIPRLPFTHPRPDTPPDEIRWAEKKGPKCVAMAQIEGAAITTPNSVDLIGEDGSRIRAKLDKCPALDFYSGFYLKPTADGMVCADRDAFRTRSGGSCGIDHFKRLVAKR